jgi:rare lipoprotein A (peptidoglycan hydrolase)
MKRLGVLVFCALLGCGWVRSADAANERRRGISVQAGERKPDQLKHSVRRNSGSTSTAHSRGYRASKARLRPGREVIDHSGRPQRGRASYYGREFNGRKMANGRPFNPNSNVAASRSLPLGTVAKVKNLENDQQTTVRVEDRGPYVPGRILDVAPKAAEDLRMREQGVAPVVVEPVAVPQPEGSVKPAGAAPPGQGRR